MKMNLSQAFLLILSKTRVIETEEFLDNANNNNDASKENGFVLKYKFALTVLGFQKACKKRVHVAI